MTLRFVDKLRDVVDGVEVILSDIWGVVHNGLEAFPEACAALNTGPLRAAELRSRAAEETHREGTRGSRAQAAPPSWVTIQMRIGSLNRHAEGGLGEVLSADDPQLGRRVAVKMLQARWAGDPRARRDFVQEAKVTSRLEHPGIVPVHGLGRSDDGRPCYSMRFVEGQTLREALDQFHANQADDAVKRALDFRGLLMRFVGVCNTVAYAHSRGVLHRDLKPENIMLGPFGETLTLDWGLAKVDPEARQRAAADSSIISSADRTLEGEVRGTPAYISPEQAAGERERIGPATDVFGLGATLYALLTGTPPYRDKKMIDLITRAVTANVDLPRQRNASAPAALEAICLKAMARQPEDRYASPLDLAHDIENWLAGERVSAWREPWHVGARRYLKRRRTLVAVLTALALVVPLVGGIGAGLLLREKGQKDIAKQNAQVKAKTAAQVTDFLQRLFATADPIGLDDPGFRGPKPEETTRRMLDEGAKLVQENLADQPLVRADLLDAMGNAYRNVGEWNKAAGMVDDALAIRQRELGVDHEKSIESLHSLARLKQDRGEYKEAERLYRRVLAWRESKYGAASLEAARVKFFLAWMTVHRPLEGPVFDQAQLQESERLFRETLAVREKHLVKDHPDIAFTLAGLAAVLACRDTDNKTELTLTMARALEIFRKNDTVGGMGVFVLEFMEAEAARKRKDFAKAEAGFLRVLEFSKKHLGPRHPLILVQLAVLVELYNEKGDQQALRKAAYEGLEIGRPLPLRSTPGMVKSLSEFGDMLLRLNDRAEAERIYAEALKYGRERPEPNAANISMLESKLAELKK